MAPSAPQLLRVTLLTGGGDRPYALGLSSALCAEDVVVDFIGSDELISPELMASSNLRFLNLRGSVNPRAGAVEKCARVGTYYLRLLKYAATAETKVFHLLWNNKVEWFDRTILMLYYKLLGKKVALTVHNVNAALRDSRDHVLNRLTLRIQYRLADRIFVHTRQMKQELESDFGVSHSRVSVIPFGLNNTVPNSDLTPVEARRRLCLSRGAKVILFFGNIAPYKGLEYLVDAVGLLAEREREYRLLIAGRPKGCSSYWDTIQQRVTGRRLVEVVLSRIEHVPDEEAEIYFKAADVLVLPYTHIYQSGVLFLGYSFGLPVIASDVGSLKEDILEGETGFVCRPKDSEDLALTIERYFRSDLYSQLNDRRREIRAFANERYSWAQVATITKRAYLDLVAG